MDAEERSLNHDQEIREYLEEQYATQADCARLLHLMVEGMQAFVVYENTDGKRVYVSMDYTEEEMEVDGEPMYYWTEAGGYSTTERHCYMGEHYNYENMWGLYYTEIFTHSSTFDDVLQAVNDAKAMIHLHRPVCGDSTGLFLETQIGPWDDRPPLTLKQHDGLLYLYDAQGTEIHKEWWKGAGWAMHLILKHYGWA